MSSYWTTLECDERIAISFAKFVDMPPRVWSIWKYEKAIGYIYEESTFWEFFKKQFDNVQG
jgi:hypothetical protein